MYKSLRNAGVAALSVAAATSVSLMANPAQAANIVFNGGFELPDITDNSFSLLSGIPGWALAPGSTGNAIEVQSGVAGAAFEGDQFVELDSTGVTGIQQTLNTIIGQQYKLSFAWAFRPVGASGTPNLTENLLNISWGGVPVLPSLAADSTAGLPTQWNVYEYLVTATSTQTLLRFDNFGEDSNSFGSYLDDVSVTAVPTPALLPGLIGLGVAALRRKQGETSEENA